MWDDALNSALASVRETLPVPFLSNTEHTLEPDRWNPSTETSDMKYLIRSQWMVASDLVQPKDSVVAKEQSGLKT